MKFVKKVTKNQLFLPLFSMVLVMLVNILYDCLLYTSRCV